MPQSHRFRCWVYKGNNFLNFDNISFDFGSSAKEMFISNSSDKVIFYFDYNHKIDIGTDLLYCEGLAKIDLHLGSGVLVISMAITHISKFCCLCHHFNIERKK